MDHTPNPFTNRGAITNEEGLIGREEQLGEIIERLRTLQSYCRRCPVRVRMK